VEASTKLCGREYDEWRILLWEDGNKSVFSMLKKIITELSYGLVKLPEVRQQ
jgi:hypothetical protein